MKTYVTMLGIISLLVCTACADQPQKTSLTLASDQPQQFSTLQWDEVSAAHEVAKVNNTGLIMMR